MLVGIEMGGTKVVCAAGPHPRRVTEQAVFPTADPATTFADVGAWLETLADGDGVEAVGVGAFGPVDVRAGSPTRGRVEATPKPGWSGVNVVDEVRAAMGRDVPVGLDTDVGAAALAEARWGAAIGADTAVYLTIGTGIGGGVVTAGRLHHGAGHPEMGHLPVARRPDDDLTSTCPFHADCVEGLAAGPALQRRFGARAEDLGHQRPAAVGLEAWYLAQLVAAVTYLLAPERVVLGGGVAKLPGLRAAVRQRTGELIGDALPPARLPGGLDAYLVAPGLGDAAGVHGALALAAEARDRPDEPPRRRTVPPPSGSAGERGGA